MTAGEPEAGSGGLEKVKRTGTDHALTRCLGLFALISLLAACGGGPQTSTANSNASAAAAPSAAPTIGCLSAAQSASLSALVAAGQALFSDTSLSASGRQSCATCHVPSRAYTADPATDDGLPVSLGGANMDLPGFRNAPSLDYACYTPAFFIASGNTPTGGFFRDGRAASEAEQAQEPFITPFEMANTNAAEVVTRLESSPTTLAKFEAVYGAQVLEQPDVALRDIGLAIAAFEKTPTFHSFSSKYDYWLEGKAQLTPMELEGLSLFNDPAKGNCNACHISHAQGYSSQALFTDFTYDNIGVPRNWSIPANLPNPVSPVDGVPLNYVPTPVDVPADAEYGWYDLGLCGPFESSSVDQSPRASFAATTGFCGVFKVPTLRNIAITAPYFHNGAFSTLQQVLDWYVTRDINNDPGNNPTPVPAGPDGNPYAPIGTFYTTADGKPDQYEYNDLPVEYDANVNIGEVPYTPPKIGGGQAPTLTSDEIDDIIAFLCTLTDGYDPNNPSAYDWPAQCQAVESATAAQ